VLYTGEIETELDEDATEKAIERLLNDGCEAIAIGFLHSYANPANELRAKQIVTRVSPQTYVLCSHEVLPISGEFERFSSTVISAYVGPSVSRYLGDLEERLSAAGFNGSLLIVLSSALMQTVDECRDRAVELLVSGPAAAPAAALDATADLAHADVLEVDMGGTSFDLCVIKERQIPTTQEAWVGEERVATKMVEVGTIGAGGGSIAWIDSLGLLRVGPQSAGADPGPAAYGSSDLPTVTDADLVLGYLPADNYLGGEIALDPEKAAAAIGSVGAKLGMDVRAAARAIFDTVNGVMAHAVSEACTKKGLDVRGFVMVAGGGAAGIHAAAIAELAGIPSIVYPASGPVLSAMGMLTMEVGREVTRAGVWTNRTAVGADEINAVFDRLTREQELAFANSGFDPSIVRHRRSLAMRYLGQFHEILVPIGADPLSHGDRAAIESDFHRIYAGLYGYSLPSRAIEILDCHLRSSFPHTHDGGARATALSTRSDAGPVGARACSLGRGDARMVPLYSREQLRPGHRFTGPALVDSQTTTVLVPELFAATVDARLNLVLTRSVESAGSEMESAAEWRNA
jgi:N-methylhydantoinase A